MTFRIRKKIKLLPGISLNVTKKGISSVSVGGKGATLNVGSKQGTKLTTSIPGTGISQTHKLSNGTPTDNTPDQPTFNKDLKWVVVVIIIMILVAISI